jgi:hypothetical protein
MLFLWCVWRPQEKKKGPKPFVLAVLNNARHTFLVVGVPPDAMQRTGAKK